MGLYEPIIPQYALSTSKGDLTAAYERVRGDLEDTEDYFDEMRRRGDENMRFYANEQWTAEELAAHARQRRKAYVFNEIQHKVEHLCGSQVQTRLDVRTIARERSDEPTVEQLNFLLKWAEQMNDIEYTESEIFKDAIIRGAGASVVRWVLEDVNYGYPKVEKIPINELWWDVTSIRPDLADASWMARLTYLSRGELATLLPNHFEEIHDLSQGSTLEFGYNLKQNTSPGKRYRIVDAWGMDTGSRDRELIQVCEHYEKIPTYQYIVADDIQGNVIKFDKQKEANAYYNGLIDQYAEDGINMYDPYGTPYIALGQLRLDRIAQTIIAGNQALERNYTALTSFPYDVSFAFFADGYYWGFVDSLIDPQIIINKAFSQWDFQLGASTKNPITVVESHLPRGYGLDRLRRELSKTSPVIPVITHAALQERTTPQINPDLFNSINFSILRMNDYAGGRNVLGFQENAAESGKAVIARAEQGGLARLPFYDKLRLWRKNLTYKMIWYIQNFMPSSQVARIIGSDEQVQFMQMNGPDIDSLKELKYDIAIEEVAKSESVKQQRMQDIRDILQVIPEIPVDIKLPLIIEQSALPEKTKEKMYGMLEVYQKYQAEQAQAAKEQKLQQQVEDSIYKERLKEQLTRKDELEKAEEEVEEQQEMLSQQFATADATKQLVSQRGLTPQEQKVLLDRAKTGDPVAGQLRESLQGLLM